MKTTNRILDVYDVSRLLGVSVTHLQSLVRQNHIVHFRLPNGDLRFEDSDVFDWLESLKEQRAAKPDPPVDLDIAARILTVDPNVLRRLAEYLETDPDRLTYSALLGIRIFDGFVRKGWPAEHVAGPARYIVTLPEDEARRSNVVIFSRDGKKDLHQPVTAAAKALDRDIADRGPDHA